jgi:hypothetical protein
MKKKYLSSIIIRPWQTTPHIVQHSLYCLMECLLQDNRIKEKEQLEAKLTRHRGRCRVYLEGLWRCVPNRSQKVGNSFAMEVYDKSTDG